ncbi:MAG TPA: hypothetical protein VFB00_03975 [Terriglobales bacterium]|nr:hypothetical protein [Terriglobales bacterium]
MSEQDFHDQVLTALGEMKAQLVAATAESKAIVARLDKLNGSVARHQEQIGQMQVEIAERRHSCPLVDHVEEQLVPIKEWVAARKAAQSVSKSWLDRLWPFIWAASGAFVLLVLLHANDLLKLKP